MFGDQRLVAVALALVATAALPAQAKPVFNRIASFPVNSNLAPEVDPKTVTSSEIIAATDDGMTLIYSDNPLGAVGFVDIRDPRAPRPAGTPPLDGEQTGRAACRERVCPYGWVTVVAVLLTKKKK